MTTINYNYDSRHDILYAKLPSPEACYGEEDDNGIVTYFGMDTDTVVGMAVFGMKQKMVKGFLSTAMLPLQIDFSDPNLQKILCE